MGLNSAVIRRRSPTPLWLASFFAIALLLLLPWLFRLNGHPHADWQQFLGRFHPLVVHLPIGLIVTVPLLELGGRFRPALREAAGVILGLAVLGSFCAVILGYLLAYGSGASGPGVTRHMWGGISLAIGALLCFLARPEWAAGKRPGVYPAMLVCLVGVLAWASHQGGSLSRGRNYLTEYMPAPMRRFTGLGQDPALDRLVADSFYARHIYPIFDANCFACHSQAKTKGGLRLDSYSLLMEGGTSGAAIVPGHPEKSLLFHRITLPLEDKKFMPSEGKPALKPEEIAEIRAWIQQGASPAVKTLAGVVLPREFHETALPQVGDYGFLIGQIEDLEKAQGISLVPVSKNLRDGLLLNTASVSSKFGDAQLATLAKFAPYIVEAELGRTQVTDACFDTLAKFPNLREIHLENTAITGKGIAQLNQLSQLTYLNLTGTKVTASAVAEVASMKSLRHLYLYNTPAQPASNTVSPVKSSQ